jgi:hypothetical protein
LSKTVLTIFYQRGVIKSSGNSLFPEILTIDQINVFFSSKSYIHWTKDISVHPDNSNNLKTESQNNTYFEQFCSWCVSWTLTLKK